MSLAVSSHGTSLPPLNSRNAGSPAASNPTSSHSQRRQSRSSTTPTMHGGGMGGGHGAMGGHAGHGQGAGLGSNPGAHGNLSGAGVIMVNGMSLEGEGARDPKNVHPSALPPGLRWSPQLAQAHADYDSQDDDSDPDAEDGVDSVMDGDSVADADLEGDGADLGADAEAEADLEATGDAYSASESGIGGDDESDSASVREHRSKGKGKGKARAKGKSTSKAKAGATPQDGRVRKTTPRATSASVPAPPSMKLQKISGLVRDSLPMQARLNSLKEEAVLEAVDNFRISFYQLFPHRPLLLLQPLNECGVPKFICSTLRPTQLPYEQLYDYESCAKFVADFITFEPLSKSYELPKYVVSPKRTLEWQVGDAVDMSIVLASLLLGVGYDAYCVLGYASKEITLKDERRIECPVLKDEKKEETSQANTGEKKYKFNPRPVLESKFQKMMEEKRLMAEELERSKAISQTRKVASREKPSQHQRNVERRIHCWVMIFAGKREVQQNIFIEATTGTCYPIEHAGYLGIESLWNHRNVWINMQTKVHAIKDLSFDLHDIVRWEHVILEAAHARKGRGNDNYHDDDGHKEDIDTGDDPEKVVDLPPSWVEKLDIPRDAFSLRCPQGQKDVVYRKCQMDMYAEYRRPDGMVSQLVLYRDYKRRLPLEVRQSFANRKDRLSNRVYYILERKTHEFFEPGRSHGLKEHIYIEGKRRTMHFYPSARLDGLVSRDEMIGKKIIETFTGREDRLIYRSITYYDKSESGKKDELIPRKMTEKFSRNEVLVADDDVAKRTFELEEKGGRIRLDFHKAPGRITASSRIHPKTGDVSMFRVDHFSKAPKKIALHEEFARLLVAEKDCATAIRESERDAKDILRARAKEEEEIQFIFSVYDTVRNKSKRQDTAAAAAAQDEPDRNKRDFLSAYLPV
eukprot:TRINITY_DN3404_c0_g1_i3.p1 TRINITY_DN3404_c0_g1~~TRINITY_DN3404_c0_g1_i3.p1  ORF type:complete len:916 (-),score=156.85 TRINITY_DN3404_c0_g1_i3:477-3224(-)